MSRITASINLNALSNRLVVRGIKLHLHKLRSYDLRVVTQSRTRNYKGV